MKLIVAIVNDNDSDEVMWALRERGFRCTKVSSTGGFLRVGNVTLMVGTEDEKVDTALATIEEHCHAETKETVTVGRATVFVLDVARRERY